MNLEWTFTAESYLDQLSPAEKSRVLHAVERLPEEWDRLDSVQLNLIGRGGHAALYSLRVGADFRVLVERRDQGIFVVDVVRTSQIDGLRRLTEARRAASG